MPSAANHYALLNLPVDATAEEIRAAYFEAARKLHPDANPEPTAAELFLRIQESYEVLSNLEQREVYDKTLPEEVFQAPRVTVSTHYSRAQVVRGVPEQVLYAYLQIKAEPDAMAGYQAPPMHVCLVLDRSTSMQNARIEMVKACASRLLREMRPEDQVSVVAFSDRADVIVPPTLLQDRARIEARINQLQAGGGTEIYHGLQAGLTLLHEGSRAASVSHMVLLTDGRTYGDETSCLQLAHLAAERRIGITGLGIGHEWNDAFLDQLTGITGGSCQFITAPKDLEKVFAQLASRLRMVYAEQVILEQETGRGVQLRSAYRLLPEAGPLPNQPVFRLGALPAGDSIGILFELLVTEEAADRKIAPLLHGRLRLEIPTRPVPTWRTLVNMALPVGSTFGHTAPPTDVMKAVSLMNWYRMQEKARCDVAEGNLASATRRLNHMVTQLMAAGENDLANTIRQENEYLSHSKRFRKEGEKRIKYATRALLLPPGLE